MCVYVYITAFLFQKGSAESNDPDQPQRQHRVSRHSPWPVRRGGWWRRIYGHSLSLALAAMFVLSFGLHAWSSTELENDERRRSGQNEVSVCEHLHGSRLWVESRQNWQ